MNIVTQNNKIIHIAIHDQKESDVAKREMGIKILKQLLDNDYLGSKLLIKQNKYGDTTDITIQFFNIEDATQFKLTYMLFNGL